MSEGNTGRLDLKFQSIRSCHQRGVCCGYFVFVTRLLFIYFQAELIVSQHIYILKY